MGLLWVNKFLVWTGVGLSIDFGCGLPLVQNLAWVCVGPQFGVGQVSCKDQVSPVGLWNFRMSQ